MLAFCGVYALKKTGDLSLKLNDVNPTEYVATSMVVLGSLIFFIAFCGCCGAIRESECLLNLFSLALVFISIFQLVMALYTCFNKDDIQNSIEKSWSTLWIGRKSNQLNEDAIHAIQNYIGCCGDKGINSYSSDDNIKTRQAHDCDVRNFSNGCRSALREFVHDSSSIISYISLAMALVEVKICQILFLSQKEINFECLFYLVFGCHLQLLFECPL